MSSEMQKEIIEQIEESIATKRLLISEVGKIAKVAESIATSFSRGGKVILFGNGGSAADSQHIAAEFVGKYLAERRPLPAIALTVNTSTLTAIGNDYGYQHVFERQVNAMCNSQDVVIGISTSGNSESVILGMKAAKSKGALTVGMTGSRKPNKLAEVADIPIVVPSPVTPRIQECHILIGHIISDIVERRVVAESK